MRNELSAAGSRVGEPGLSGWSFFIDENDNQTLDAGETSTDVYATLFIGQESIAKVIGYRRQTVVGPVVDSLRRFQPVGDRLRIPAAHRLADQLDDRPAVARGHA